MAVKSTKTTIAKARGAGSKALAVHKTDGETHLVGIGSLRVLICKDGNTWFAQGLEIDYAASGKTIAKAKTNFEVGLKGTIGLHVNVHGGIENFLKPAPASVWKQLWSDKHYEYSQVSIHEDVLEKLGFGAINYFEPTPEVAA
jgi:hypothetical protein